MKKRLLSAILSLCMLLTMAPTVAFAAEDDEAAAQNNSVLEGSCGAEGDNVTWNLTENDDSLYCVADDTTWRFYDNHDKGGEKVQAYTLTIAGNGAMADYERNTTPWGLKLAKILNADTTKSNIVSDYCSPRITRIEFAAGSNVIYIGAHAFRSTSISSIAIPDSVKSIGAYAFIMCRHLTSIKASKLSDRAFYAENDVLYEDYTENGQSGVALRFFPLAKWDKDYTIDSRVTAIGNNSMQQAEITSVTIPATVRSINSFAFNSSEITSVTFEGTPSFGTEFETGTAGSGIFSNCTNLTTINNFPKNVEVLPASLFSGAVSLTHFEIPASVTEIGDTVFSNTGITAITIPSGVSKIGSRVFSTSVPEGEGAVRSSVEVTFEKGSKLASIGSACFVGLNDYTAIFDPEDEAAYGAFAQAGYQVSLAGHKLPQNDTFVYGWVDKDSVQIIGLTDEGKNKAAITIPDTAVSGEQSYQVVGIGDSVFAGTADKDANITLTSVKLGANLKYISSNAFKYCTHLINVDFSKADKLERIGSNAFYDTKAVTSWDLSACKNLTTVDTGAFNYTKAPVTIKLPANIARWGNTVINSNAVTVHAAASSETFRTLVAVLNAGKDTFTFGGETGNTEKFTYESRYENGAFIVTITGFASDVSEEDKATVKIPDTITVKGADMAVTAVANQAFSEDYNKIKTVTIGANVATIGNYAFATTHGNANDGTLESVTFEAGVPVSIGTRAFQKYGSSFKKFDAGNRKVALGDHVFLSDAALIYVNISNATSLGKGVFYGLDSATTTSGTLVINGAAKSNAKSFENVTNVTSPGHPLSKMTVYVVGDNGNAGDTTIALEKAGVNILCLTDGGTFPADTSFEANKLAEPTKTGYTFAGWYSSSDFAKNTRLENGTAPAAKTTYYAKWTMTSSITLSSNEKDAVTVTYGTPVTLTTDSKSSQWTYSWYKDADKNNALDIAKDTKIDNDSNDSSTLVLNNVSDSGTYWVVVSDGKETVTSNNVTVNIGKANGTASVSLSGWTYGKTANNPVPTSDTNGIDKVTYQYKVKDTEDTNYSGTLPTDAGDYTVKATFAATDNYNEVTATADFTIAKATPAIAIKATPSTLTGGGSVELTVSGVPTEGTLAVTCDNNITVNEKDGKYTATLPNETKDYTFKADYTGTDLYNNNSDTCIVSVTYKGRSHHSSSASNTVSASTASNGKVTMDKSSAKKGDTVTITVTPDAGYELGKLTVTDAKGNTIATTKKDDNKYTFTMPDGKVTVTPTFTKIAEEKPSNSNYVDVASSAWYNDAVQYVTDKGLMSGTGDKKFSPNASTTRGMLMTVLARCAGKDTAGSTPWYQAGMDWAKENGVSDGTKPTESITREQLVTMLYRSAGSPAASGSLDNFSDSASVSGYAVNAMKWAVANGIVNGSNGKLNPKNNATRAEVAAILMRFCEKTEK